MITLCVVWRQCLIYIIWNVKDFPFCPWGILAHIKWKHWTLLNFIFCHPVIYTFTYKSKISLSLWFKKEVNAKEVLHKDIWKSFCVTNKKFMGVDSFIRNWARWVGVEAFFSLLICNRFLFPDMFVTNASWSNNRFNLVNFDQYKKANVNVYRSKQTHVITQTKAQIQCTCLSLRHTHKNTLALI